MTGVDKADPLARLERWTLPKHDYVPEAAIAEVCGHPRFGEALRHIFKGALDHAARDPTHLRVFHDLERFVLGIFTVALDFTGGITHQRLTELGSEGRMMSSGRATAMLLYMRRIGYVRRAERVPGSRGRGYVATQALHDSMKARMRLEFEAAAMIDPQVAPVAGDFENPETFRAVAVQLAEILRHATRGGGRPEFTSIEAIASRRSGMLLLQWLALTLDGGGAFPRGGTLTAKIAALARQLETSRSHILSLLRALERAGFYRRGGSADSVDDAFARTLARFYATLIIGALDCSATVLRARAATN